MRSHKIFSKKYVLGVMSALVFLFAAGKERTALAEGAAVPYPKVYDVSALTGDPRKDVLTIAASQVGYTEARDENGKKLTYYSKELGIAYSNWCSEFAAWCLRKAGVPYSLAPASKLSAAAYMAKWFGSQGRMYLLSGGAAAQESFQRKYAASIQTIDISQVQAGDIVLVNSADVTASVPSHTAIVRSIDAEKVYTIDGNKGSPRSKVAAKSYTLDHVFAILKPFYELYPVSGVRIEKTESKALKLTWQMRSGVSGYRIYRTLHPADETGELMMIAQMEGEGVTSYVDEEAENITAACYYKVVPYILSGDKIYDGVDYLGQFSYYNEPNSCTAQLLPASRCTHIGQWVEISKGSCLTLNTVQYTCRLCGYSKVKQEQYANHTYTKQSVSKASVDTPNVDRYTCSVCGDTYTESSDAETFKVNGLKYKTLSSQRLEVTGATSKNVTSIVIPAMVKYNGKQYTVSRIAEKAFRKYRKLRTVKIEANLTQIRAQAFYSCKALRKITFTSPAVPAFKSKAFKNIYKKAVFYVPAEAKASYKKAIKKAGFLKKKIKVKAASAATAG